MDIAYYVSNIMAVTAGPRQNNNEAFVAKI